MHCTQAVYTVKKCSWKWASLSLEACRAGSNRSIKRSINENFCNLLVTYINVLRLTCPILFSGPYCKEIFRAHMTRCKRVYLKLKFKVVCLVRLGGLCTGCICCAVHGNNTRNTALCPSNYKWSKGVRGVWGWYNECTALQERWVRWSGEVVVTQNRIQLRV